MKRSCALAIGLTLALASDAVLPQNTEDSDSISAKDSEFSRMMAEAGEWRRIYRSGPHRPLGSRPLRYENISDIEVREIENAAREVMPGAIVNISGVTTGCPCEDGPECTDQVWIVAYRPERTMGLMFSKIDGHWAVGPTQRWWLRHSELEERIWHSFRRRDSEESMVEYEKLIEQRQRLFDSFPACTAEPRRRRRPAA